MKTLKSPIILTVVFVVSCLFILFAAEQAEAQTGVWQSCETGTTLLCGQSWDYSMGYQFTPTKNGQITHLCGYFSGTKSVRLYNSAYSVLAGAQVTSSNTWSCTSLPSPGVSVYASQVYYVVVELAGSGGCYRYMTAFPTTCQGVTINNSVYQSPSGTFNVSHYSQTSPMYGMADVVFAETTVSYTLSVSKTGTGSGTVTSSPSGIDCGSTCSASFNSGTSVTLTASAGSGSTFTGWSGDCSGTGTCSVSMTANRSVTANFDTAAWTCGNPLTVTHTAGSVAPVTKTVTYGTVSSTLGGTGAKCWITQNLGADSQAPAVNDANEDHGGWYWQFNRKQGYKHDGTTLTPSWTITSIDESSDWSAANDPCTLLLGTDWRIPTYAEWTSADSTGGWTSWTQPFASALKLHAAGALLTSSGALYARGGINGDGYYWSSTQSSTTNGGTLSFDSSFCTPNPSQKALGLSVRCIQAPPPVPPCSSSTVTWTYKGGSVTYGTVMGAGSRCWLDRNLGATQVATSQTDSAAYGDLFQWGRLDDGHQNRTSGTTTTLSSSDNPGHSNFILVQSIPPYLYDWRSPQNDNLWQGVSGINNPCPSGYRLPTQAEWNTERLSWGSNNSAGAYASPLKLPVSGRWEPISNTIQYVGTHGWYWSSSLSTTRSLQISFYATGSDSGSDQWDVRAYGYSVRCLKDSAPAPTYTLSVSKTGTGSGTISSSPSGIDCGSTCSASFSSGTVTLTAAPASGSTFTGWSGEGCSGTGTCSVSMTANRSVTANFNTAAWTCGDPLTVTHTAGTVAPVTKTVTYGTVVSSLSGASKCWITQNLGATTNAATVSESTEPNAGWYWQFNRKQGYKHDGTTLTPSWTITSITENSGWTAANDPCTLLLGTGWRIPTNAEWTNADSTGGWTSWTQPFASALKLHAAGALNSGDGILVWRGQNGHSWSSSQLDSTNGYILTFTSGASYMDNNSKATGFPVRCLKDSTSTYTFSVSKTGTGSGTVTSSPTGIDCGATCSASFSSGTSVSLTATASSGSTFTGWSGEGCSGTGTCTVSMTANRSVTANFSTVTYTLSVSKTGTGSGTVTSSPSGIDCGSTCSASFSSGTSVTLTATAAGGSTFTGWSGDCSGMTCAVSMTANRSVTAEFTSHPCQNHNVSGWAWSENIGWISFSCKNQGAAGDYGLDIADSTGLLSGYAWSENIGWITFNESELTGCPTVPCQGKLDLLTKQISGWSRACSVFQTGCSGTLDPNRGGWEGWIRSRGINYGAWVNAGVSPAEFRNWAWSDMNIGWITFNCVDINCGISNYKVITSFSSNLPPVANFSCLPASCTIYSGENLTLDNNSSDPDNNLARSEWDILNWGSAPDLSCCASGCDSSTILCDYTVQSSILGRGTYSSKLTVKDAFNETDSLTKTINIKQDAIADFKCSLDNSTWVACPNFEAQTGQTVYFLDQSSPSEGASIISLSWAFQDATPSTANTSNPQTKFNKSGIKTVSLSIQDSAGRSASKSYNLKIQMSSPDWEEIAPY